MERRRPVRPREEAVELIECYIRKQKLAPRSKLPSERDMCEMWNLNRTTLRHAVKRLTEEGKLYSVKGSGTYIAAQRLERNLQDIQSTSEVVRRAGRVLDTRVLDVAVLESNIFVARELEVPLGHRVFSLRRLRIMDGEPYMIEHSYVNYDCCRGIENIDFTDESLYRALENRYNVRLCKGSESIGITYATEDEAKLLQVKEEQHLFYLTGTSRTADNHVTEYFRSVARPDKARFYSFLRRCGPRSKGGQEE